MNAPTLYLMSKYTGREADSLKENQDAWLALDQKGYLVYSPICESHNIEEYRKSSLNRDRVVPILQYGKEPDYVARDLQLLENWLKHDSECCPLIICNQIGVPCYKCQTRNQYDSGVVGVVLPSAVVCNCGGCGTNYFREVKPPYISCCPERQLVLGWKSKGALKEYEFMQSHHILCITLETALTVPPEQWKECGL